MAHSFAYWAQALHEADLLAPCSRLLGLTNNGDRRSQEASSRPCALQMYVRHPALELARWATASTCSFGTVSPRPSRHARPPRPCSGPPRRPPRDDPGGACTLEGRRPGVLSCATRAPGSTARRSISPRLIPLGGISSCGRPDGWAQPREGGNDYSDIAVLYRGSTHQMEGGC
jgi:hypothetical protein